MKKNIMFLTSIFIAINAFSTTIVWAWDNEFTHKELTEQAARQSSLGASDGLFLIQLGFSKDIDEVLLWNNHVCDDGTKKNKCTIKEWLRYGAEKEDAMFVPLARMYNHFHDPYRDSGLDDFLTGESALWWAQDTVGQSNDPLQGDQSWATLRQLYYDALTTSTDTARQAKFAQLFKGLGHQMHLLQDMAVPPHVRNDSHAVESFLGVTRLGQTFFESWAKKNQPLINLFASGPAIFPTLSFNSAYADTHQGTATCPEEN